MRKLGQSLGVDPMSLYNHVRDKDDLLDAVADAIVGEIEPEPERGDWIESLRGTVLAARATMLRHPWAAEVLESRETPGPATMRYMDLVLGILRQGGFLDRPGAHGLHVLGSRVFGFSQDLFDDKSEPVPDAEALQAISATWAKRSPISPSWRWRSATRAVSAVATTTSSSGSGSTSSWRAWSGCGPRPDLAPAKTSEARRADARRAGELREAAWPGPRRPGR